MLRLQTTLLVRGKLSKQSIQMLRTAAIASGSAISILRCCCEARLLRKGCLTSEPTEGSGMSLLTIMAAVLILRKALEANYVRPPRADMLVINLLLAGRGWKQLHMQCWLQHQGLRADASMT